MSATPENASLSTRLSRPPANNPGPDDGLDPIVAPDVALSPKGWARMRASILARWEAVLGKATLGDFDRSPERVRAFELPECSAAEYLLPTTPSSRQRVLLMTPREPASGPRPAALVPFYNPDLMAGYDLESGEPKDAPNVHFGRHLVQLGFVVVCGQAFPFNTVEDPGTGAPFAHWYAAAAKLREEYPAWTGMGRLVHDTRVSLDFLLDQPDIDEERILIIGHSLGGKMAFYTGCLDSRITAILASDFGIAFESTNWEAPWYLGAQIQAPTFPLAHHHLLALAAPKPFLIIAGQCDGPRSWQYIDAVRPVYRLYGREHALGILDHASGHRPPDEAVQMAYRWLEEQFDLDPRDVDI